MINHTKKWLKIKLRLNLILVSDFIIMIVLTAHWSDWTLVCFFCIICLNWRSAETDYVDIFFNNYLDILIRWSDRSAWSDWLLTKVDCSSVILKSDEEESVFWDSIESSTVNSEV